MFNYFYLIGMRTGSSLAELNPSFEPRNVKNFNKATAAKGQMQNRAVDGASKLNADNFNFEGFGRG